MVTSNWWPSGHDGVRPVLGPYFEKKKVFDHLDSKEKTQNSPNIVIEAINAEIHATIDNPDWL